MPEDAREIEKVIKYMESHWPSKVKPEWQVKLEEYPKLSKQVVEELTMAATKNHRLIRIAGVSGSGKTTQVLPAVEEYCEKNEFEPILIAVRKFVKYHPHFEEIKDFYGDEDLRKMTDEFCTIMLFLTLRELIKGGYDIVLDVTLLDPEMEGILLKMLDDSDYEMVMLLITASAAVTEYYLSGRSWRHTKEAEKEFRRATPKALEYYALKAPEIRVIVWNVYDEPPVYDGPMKNVLDIYNKYAECNDLPKDNDDARRDAKIKYLLDVL